MQPAAPAQACLSSAEEVWVGRSSQVDERGIGQCKLNARHLTMQGLSPLDILTSLLRGQDVIQV